MPGLVDGKVASPEVTRTRILLDLSISDLGEIEAGVALQTGHTSPPSVSYNSQKLDGM